VRIETDSTVSVSVTTRGPRSDEREGEAYYFISNGEFDALIENDGLLEYADVFGNKYGTPKQPVIDALFAGRNMILEIDVQGAMQVKTTFPEGILIFVLPPSLETLRERIVRRGTETAEDVDRRLGEAMREIEYLPEYDYVIVNDDLDAAVAQTRSVMEAEGLRLTPGSAKTFVEKFRKKEIR
jgi:guanylate kinase